MTLTETTIVDGLLGLSYVLSANEGAPLDPAKSAIFCREAASFVRSCLSKQQELLKALEVSTQVMAEAAGALDAQTQIAKGFTEVLEEQRKSLSAFEKLVIVAFDEGFKAARDNPEETGTGKSWERRRLMRLVELAALVRLREEGQQP